MKRLIALFVLLPIVAFGQLMPIQRNFFTTKPNPSVVTVAGSNVTVQATTTFNTRTFTVNVQTDTNVVNLLATNAASGAPIYGSNVVGAVAQSTHATNADNATYAGFATNASNATNFWGVLNATNLPSQNYISNYNGVGTNLIIYGDERRTNALSISAGGLVSSNANGSVTLSGRSITSDGRLTITPGQVLSGGYEFIDMLPTTTDQELVADTFGTRTLFTLSCTNAAYHSAAILGETFIPASSSLNSSQYVAGLYGYVNHLGSGALSEAIGTIGVLTINGSGHITEGNAFESLINQQTGSGHFDTVRNFYAAPYRNDSSATRPNLLVGFQCADLGVDGDKATSVFAFRSLGDTPSSLGPLSVSSLYSSGPMTNASTTDATGADTGAFQVAGGASFKKSVWVGNRLVFPTTLTDNTIGIAFGTESYIYRYGAGNLAIEPSSALFIGGDMLPKANATYDFGSESFKWRQSFVSGASKAYSFTAADTITATNGFTSYGGATIYGDNNRTNATRIDANGLVSSNANGSVTIAGGNTVNSGSVTVTNGVRSYGTNNLVEVDGLGTTITPALWLTNGTAAALGAQQVSPALMFGGQGWRSGNSTTMPVQLGLYLLPSQGSSANPSGTIYLVSSISNSAPASTGIFFTSGGTIFGNAIASTTYLQIGASYYFVWNGRSAMYSPADSDIQFMNNGGTAFSRLFLGPLTAAWPALKVESTNYPTLSLRNGADNNYTSLLASNVIASANVIATNAHFSITPTNANASTANFLNPHGLFGGIYMSATNTVTVGSGGTYYNLTNYTTAMTNQFTSISTNGFLTNLVAGYYRVTAFVSCLGGNSDTLEGEVFVNETGQEYMSVFGSYDNPARVRTMSTTGILYLPANSGVSFRLNNRSGANNITVWRAGLTIGTP